MKFNQIISENAPEALGPYSQGVLFNNTLFTSGQIPIDRKSNEIPNCIFKQTTVCLQNIQFILNESKFHINEIIKITIFTTKLEKLNVINEAYKKFFDCHQSVLPARTCIGVSKLPKNVNIEIEAIAFKTKKE
ncbi:Rid family detoxifying hydrolase [Buchnera aphidicola (Mindarus keteleerifoliae)]|uniref:Rid family detoxifying hydrolase n=1 Tax=Buchnera aphidicola TaxID=9 RepID=UPI0031B68982